MLECTRLFSNLPETSDIYRNKETIAMEKPSVANQEFVGASRNKGSEPPSVQGIGQFKLQLTLNGSPIGWFGLGGTGSYWGCVVTNEKDATIMSEYAYNGHNYLKSAAGYYMTWSGTLSGSPIAFNYWSYANGWKLVGSELIPDDKPDGKMSLYSSDSGWLYANSGYSVLGVKKVPVSANADAAVSNR